MDINQIANQASQISNVTKRAAWGAIRELIDLSENLEEDSRQARSLAELYRYFMPLPGKTVKTAEDWCKKAVGKKDIRTYLNFLYSDGSRLIGCDGHRLHIIETTDYKAGYYDMALNPVEDKGRYPNVDRVIPAQKGREIRLSTITGGKIEVYDKGEAINVKGAWVNRKYFNEAIAGFDPEKLIRYYNEGELKPIKLQQGERLAVVMPMRV